jgi:hypothetical protein
MFALVISIAFHWHVSEFSNTHKLIVRFCVPTILVIVIVVTVCTMPSRVFQKLVRRLQYAMDEILSVVISSFVSAVINVLLELPTLTSDL